MKRAIARFGRYAVTAMVVCAGLATTLHAQENARQFYGEIISGYSGNSFQDVSTSGPYVGLQGDFLGYWKDPRLLQYEVTPNLVNGFQWTGPMVGPASNGFDASTTFLGGSRFPLSAYFSRENTPIADFGLASLFRPTSNLTRRYGVSWSVNMRRLPSFAVRYSNDDVSYLYSDAFTGDSKSKAKNFNATTGYSILGWSLSGSYSQASSDAFTTLQLIGAEVGAVPLPDKSDTKVIGGFATRELPLMSHLTLEYTNTDQVLDLQGNRTDISYDRASVGLSSRPFSRLDTMLQATYMNDYSSFLEQQSLTTGIINPVDLAFITQHSAVVTGGASASFRVQQNLRVNAGYSTNQTLSGTAVTNFRGVLPSTDTYNAGVNYYRTLFGGKMTSGYSFSTTTTEGASNFDAVTHSGNLSYEHRLPWEVDLTTSAIVGVQSLSDGHDNRTNTYGFNVAGRRKISAWTADARFSYNRFSYIYPSTVTNGNKDISLSMTSNRMSFMGHFNTGRNLSYLFGNTIVNVPGAIAVEPTVFLNTTHAYGFSGTYNVWRHLVIVGAWNAGTQSLNDASDRTFHNYYGKAEYRFRHVKLAAGYGSSSEYYQVGTNGNVNSRYYYFQIKRDFRLF